MTHFPKPAEGSWTEHWPEISTAPVDYTDSVDPAHYELEREAIFKKTWLMVGRVEQVPRVGSYLTRELHVADTSVIIVRGKDKQVRAFYNICRHRGNKLVWNDYPDREVSGRCRVFTCKYHAWRYELTGDLSFVQQEGEFFNLDKSQYGLKPVRCEIWEGFIFINLDPGAAPLLDYLGEWGKDLAGYPFGEMTEVFTYRAEIGSNWKLFIDAFAEFYHAPILHMKQAVRDQADKLAAVGFEGLHYDLRYPHSMVSSWGGMSPPKDLRTTRSARRSVPSPSRSATCCC
jgi:phenylpropionate dioxygenase-like ring-hydroxylating dioxygenase large terminal subunit